MGDMMIVLALTSLITTVLCFDDPGVVMMRCIDETSDLDYCAAQTMEDFRDVMETGIEELDLPPLDPIFVDAIDFRFFNLTIEILDVFVRGFRNFKLEKSSVDKSGRTWDVELSLPRISTVGVYKMSGTIPPNLDLGFSTGDQRSIPSLGRIISKPFLVQTVCRQSVYHSKN